MNKKYYIVNDEILKLLNFIHLLLSIIRGIIDKEGGNNDKGKTICKMGRGKETNN